VDHPPDEFVDALRSAWVLAGPTACGKSVYGMQLAETWNMEVISMDSMALYRGMDIGTAKPSPAERARVPHHLIDVLEPWESANVAWWLGRAAECSREIQRRGKRVLIVGGSPLYLKALLSGLFRGPPVPAEVRRRWEQQAAAMGSGELHRRLSQVDPATAKRLHPNDLRRIVRALEVWEATGKPISEWQQQWRDSSSMPRRLAACCWLDRPRRELYQRIEQRVDQMIGGGWAEEAKRLLELPRPLSREARQAVGYSELFDYWQGKWSLASAIDRIKTRTRQFAKRQLTWFRALPQCRPLAMIGDQYPAADRWPEVAHIAPGSGID
jgi:tRNA dimethylallyltransferase